MTDAPKTLLQMAGAPLEPAPLSKAVLVIIDAQNEYRTGALPLAGVDAALAEIARLLERARATDTPVIHVAHKGKAGGVFDQDAEGGRIMREVAPACAETVVNKPLPNAFANTGLAEILEKTGRKELILAGFMTHMCVSSTARAALDLGYRSTLVADACATRDLPAPDGGVMKAADLHRAALTALADRFAVIAKDVDSIED